MHEERRELMVQLRAMAATGAATGEGVEAGARLQANIAAETSSLTHFQARVPPPPPGSEHLSCAAWALACRSPHTSIVSTSHRDMTIIAVHHSHVGSTCPLAI